MFNYVALSPNQNLLKRTKTIKIPLQKIFFFRNMSHNREIFIFLEYFWVGNHNFGDFLSEEIQKIEAQIRTQRKKLGRAV